MWGTQAKERESRGCQPLKPLHLPVDGSNITADGWKGDKKWSTLLDSPIICSGDPAILVIDEADKMLAPKYSSHSENVSQSIAARMHWSY